MSRTHEDQSEVGADDPLLSVVYVSAATAHFSDVDLALLLSASRLNNEAHGLTGLLLYQRGQFMQLLEGPRAAVRTTLAKIAADPRHSGVWTLDERTITERRFGSWAMGYRSLTEADLASAPEWLGSPEALVRRDDSRAGELLAWFRGR